MCLLLPSTCTTSWGRLQTPSDLSSRCTPRPESHRRGSGRSPLLCTGTPADGGTRVVAVSDSARAPQGGGGGAGEAGAPVDAGGVGVRGCPRPGSSPGSDIDRCDSASGSLVLFAAPRSAARSWTSSAARPTEGADWPPRPRRPHPRPTRTRGTPDSASQHPHLPQRQSQPRGVSAAAPPRLHVQHEPLAPRPRP